VALLAVLVVFLHSGFLGLNYGKHWDEWYHFSGVRKSIERLSLLTGEYTYNGMYFLPGQVVVGARALPKVPAILREIKASPTRPLDDTKYPTLVALKDELGRYTRSEPFVLTMRFVFMAMSALGIVFIFMAARRLWPRRPAVAALAALHFGTSWHLAFHSRFIA